MKKYIIGGIIGCLIAVAALGVANYYTCFAYYLPHEPAVIDVAPGDMFASARPSYILVPYGLNATSVVSGEPSSEKEAQ